MRLSLQWRYGLALFLGFAGLCLNDMPVFLLTRETPPFAFGGALLLFSFVSLGTGPGLASAAVCLSPLLARLDLQSVAAPISLVEAWAACLLYRRFKSLVFTVAVFWFSVGWVLDFAILRGVGGLPLDFLTLIFIKQVFNGILNAILAEGLLRIPAIATRLPSHDSILSNTLKQYVFSRVFFVVLIPAVVLAILYTRAVYEGAIEDRADLMPSAYRILLLLVANLVAVYAVVVRFARKVSEPLRAVDEAAKEIAGGRLPSATSLQELAQSPIGEIQSVALHFMTMRDAIAYRDPLTGLPNRRLFIDRLGTGLAQARRNREGLAVFYVDLDRFRIVEDSLGHSVGNLILRTVADRLQGRVGQRDTVARLGADEFVVLVRPVDREGDATRLARKLLEAVRIPFAVGERELFVTASIGLSLFPADGDAAEPLLNNAHTAMHQAKGEGRDTFRLYTSAMNDRALEDLSLESELRRALSQGEFEVHYQPLLNLRTFLPDGAEALIRWRHPERGLLAASQFISLAESSGLIVEIDSWVLRTACARAREWHRAGHTGLKVEVNLSARQFQQPDLVEDVTRCLRETGLPASALEIEITERVAMLDVDRSVAVLQSLRALGVGLALDDFGTGYSSLSYLKTLPVNTLKLDQSFVRQVATDAGDAAIATAVIVMAHSLGLKVVAEGVETPEQLAFLRDRGCDFAQGYLVGVPMPGERLETLFERRLELVPPQ
jgi:diguanylate cyclase (GGDEF)-like protein